MRSKSFQPKKPFKKPFQAPPAPTAFALRAQLRAASSPEQAKTVMGFFKTGPGEYAEGDQFIGIKVPDIRKIIKPSLRMPIREIESLLKSKIHEERLAALLILVARVDQGGPKVHQEIYDFFMAHLPHINNWDLVDASAAPIVGAWLHGQDGAVSRKVLCQMAQSKNMWERRIAMVATHHFIKAGESKTPLALARMLLADEHDLIHKAVGWMLREVGKQIGQDTLRGFLEEHAPKMPRTALRYAIEHFSPEEKAAWLAAG